MAESRFLYVIYIFAPPQKIWDHLTDPEMNKKFWSGYHQDSSWRVGADYKITAADGRVWDEGKVLESDPPRRLRVSWNHLADPAMQAEGESICTFELEAAQPGVTKLTLTHEIGVADSKLIVAVSGGWPSILSGLKTLVESGHTLAARDKHPLFPANAGTQFFVKGAASVRKILGPRLRGGAEAVSWADVRTAEMADRRRRLDPDRRDRLAVARADRARAAAGRLHLAHRPPDYLRPDRDLLTDQRGAFADPLARSALGWRIPATTSLPARAPSAACRQPRNPGSTRVHRSPGLARR